ncbi:DUF979 domain-containing protein [Candidatus Stoquefichus massiliensis]|uniref:DUF979 domain-containing protein n=1 Tax=Candidatus Stoquefichus massiliensis TaxID=1470350 RepID=UPI000482D3C3|nr:DUF979 domain-containing protein [Candidatus Stoquefichus massiliensis]
MTEFLGVYLPEFFYVLCGLVSFDAAIRATKNEKAKIGTSLFWCILGIIFMFGKLIPSVVTGGLLVIMGCLTATKQVKMGKFVESTAEARQAASEKVGSKIFIPAVSIGIMALILSFIKYSSNAFYFSFRNFTFPLFSFGGTGDKIVALDGAVMTGTACLVALILAIVICKPRVSETRSDTSRLLMQVGASCLLPQLLGALGEVFKVAGVGEVISKIISSVVPSGNIVIGVIVYVLGMVIFTMIMGNAFAAFTVITIGIGYPFVIAQGGNPAVIGALGMTAGYCGTLMTPMAANFNIVPCAVLETKDQKWAVIKAQLPMALIMIVIHIILMLVLGF